MSRITMKSGDTDSNSMYLVLNKESSIQLGTVLLNAEENNKMESHALLSETVRSSSPWPSTPVYSDSTLFNIDDKSSSFDSKEFGPSNMRFIAATVAAIAFFIQVFSQSIWSAIYEPALVAFPNWSGRSLALLPIWSSGMTAMLVFPACLTINKFGLKVSLLWSCGFFTLGTAVRCLPSMYSSTMYLHLSAMCLSAGGVFMTPLVITISAQWFPQNERNIATGFCSAMGMLGSAATYVIGPRVVSADSADGPLDQYGMRSQIIHLLYACFGLNVFVTFLVYLVFPKRTRPVSYTSKLSIVSHRSAKLFSSLEILVKDFDMWCLVLAFTLTNTMSAPWSAMLPSTFSKLRVSSELSATCGLFMVLHTFALSLSFSTFADRAPGYSKELAVFSRLVALVFLFWLMLMMDFRAKLTTTNLTIVVLMAFPYSWCSQSILYEMGAELMCPLPESFVAGYMTLLNNLFVDFVYAVIYLYPRFDEYWLHIGVFVLSVVSMIFLLMTTSDRTRKITHTI